MEIKRMTYFDTAKALLILLVVIGHVLIVINPKYDIKLYVVIQAFIYTFHMSAFFILHGVLFNNEKWEGITSLRFIKKKFASLIIPYIFFELLGLFCKFIFLGQDIHNSIRNTLTVKCNVGADWFLIAMFMGSLLFLIYVKHPSRIYAFVSTALCIIIPIFCSDNQVMKVLGRGMLAYSFIMIGNLGKNIFRSSKVKSFLEIVSALIITGGCALIGLKFGGNDFYECIVKNPVILVVGGCSGTLMILGISQCIQTKLISMIGRHTLTIMGTHQLVIYAMTSLIPGMDGGSLSLGFLLLLTIIVFEIPAVYLIDRYLPFLVGRKWK